MLEITLTLLEWGWANSRTILDLLIWSKSKAHQPTLPLTVVCPWAITEWANNVSTNTILLSFQGAAFGFNVIAAKAGEQLAPFLPQLLPRLYRYQFDPNLGIRQAMTSIWNALVTDKSMVSDQQSATRGFADSQRSSWDRCIFWKEGQCRKGWGTVLEKWCLNPWMSLELVLGSLVCERILQSLFVQSALKFIICLKWGLSTLILLCTAYEKLFRNPYGLRCLPKGRASKCSSSLFKWEEAHGWRLKRIPPMCISGISGFHNISLLWFCKTWNWVCNFFLPGKLILMWNHSLWSLVKGRDPQQLFLE